MDEDEIRVMDEDETKITDELVMQGLLNNIDFVMDAVRPDREDLGEVFLAVNCYHEFMKALFLKKELRKTN